MRLHVFGLGHGRLPTMAFLVGFLLFLRLQAKDNMQTMCCYGQHIACMLCLTQPRFLESVTHADIGPPDVIAVVQVHLP